MTVPDIVNGTFEFCGAAAGAWNCRVLLRDKAVKGFAPVAWIFFTSWGCWNIYYYPHLHQYVSLAGTICITFFNGLYAGLGLHYSRRK